MPPSKIIHFVLRTLLKLLNRRTHTPAASPVSQRKGCSDDVEEVEGGHNYLTTVKRKSVSSFAHEVASVKRRLANSLQSSTDSCISI